MSQPWEDAHQGIAALGKVVEQEMERRGVPQIN